MKELTLWDTIKGIFCIPYWKLEYFFAKRWLDKHFGKREYWGDYLREKL